MERITIVNDVTGEPEEWTTRLSRRAFGDWVRDRAMLRAAGRPDRPPDVDNDGLRAWVAHPGEESHPYFTAQAMQSGHPTFPVMAVAWTARGILADLMVTGHMDGSFTVRVRVSDGEVQIGGVEVEFDPEQPPAAVGDGIESLLETWGEMIGPDSAVRLHTITDFAGVLRDMKQAEAELTHVGFLSPLPEGPIQ